MSLFLKHFCYPMLMLLVAMIAGADDWFTTMTNIQGIDSLLYTFVKLLPFVLIVMLWLHRMKKMKNAKTITAVFLFVGSAIAFFGVIYTLVKHPDTNFKVYLQPLSYAVCYLALGIALLKNSKMWRTILGLVCVTCVALIIFLNFQDQLEIHKNYLMPVLSLLKISLVFAALADVPKVFHDIDEMELTGVRVAFAVILVMFLMVPHGANDGTASNNRNDSSIGDYYVGEKGTCADCGRSIDKNLRFCDSCRRSYY